MAATPSKSALRGALAREAYAQGRVRIADDDLRGFDWLVASPQGVFAVSAERVKTVVYGWFFGLCRHGDALYLFENCGHRDDAVALGRIVRIGIVADRLTAPGVLATALHNNCHQVAVIDDRLCVVDTAQQQILRFDLDGRAIDVLRPFPPAPITDRSGAYLHINAVAQVEDRIAILLHNGKALPEKPSELAWLDRDWRVIERTPLPGYSCHDIIRDDRGRLWHSASMSGEIIASDGVRVKITNDMMTRGIAFGRDAMIVGIATFGPRHVRDKLRGGVVILDRALTPRATLTLPAAPTDIVALR